MSFNRNVSIDPREPRMQLAERLAILRRLAEGGLGIIDEVEDSNLLSARVIKRIKPEYDTNPLARTHFIKEAQIMGQLDHPNIVPVHELGVNPRGKLYFTMKRVEGETLTKRVRANPPKQRTARELKELLRVFCTVCDAVAFAHGKGVIHCDIKPDNIMLGDHRQVYLMDWGISVVKAESGTLPLGMLSPDGTRKRFRMTDRDAVSYTPEYAAPEQRKGRISDIDERTDIYLLGGTLFEILCNRAPFIDLPGNTAPPVDPPDPCLQTTAAIPQMLAQIAMKAMSHTKEGRYRTVEELRQAVEDEMQGGWQFKLEIFPKGTEIVREGEPADAAYVIVNGSCDVFKIVDGQLNLLRIIEANDVFGETGLFAGGVRTATVQAREEVVARVIRHDQFKSELGMNEWMERLVRALAERFIEKDRQVLELVAQTEEAANGSGPPIDMVRSVLDHLITFGLPSPSGLSARWSVLAAGLADRLGVSFETARETVEGTGLFTVDADRDVVSYRKGG